MDFNWQKGLVGMASGALSGYTSILSKKAEADLESKKQDAMLQREKSMAKYNQGLKQETWKAQKDYELGQMGSGWGMEDTGKEVTKSVYDQMTEEQRKSLKSMQDIRVAQELDLAEKKTTKEYEVKKGLLDKEKKEDINNTVAYMSDKLNWDETQQAEAIAFMEAQGITKPSELQAAMASTAKSLDPEDVNRIISNATAQTNKAMEGITEPLKTARKMGYKGKSDDEASLFLRGKLQSKYESEGLLKVMATQKKSPRLLDLTKKEKGKEDKSTDTPEDAIKTMVNAVLAGDTTLEEVKAQQPGRYMAVKQQVDKLTNAPGRGLQGPQPKGQAIPTSEDVTQSYKEGVLGQKAKPGQWTLGSWLQGVREDVQKTRENVPEEYKGSILGR